jgi:hypothetical protein
MPNWKKLIYSGSAAVLTNVTASSYTGSFTGSFSGTFTSASYALSASYAPSSPSAAFPFTGSAEISGSLAIKGGNTSASTKVFHIQTGDGTSIMDFRNNTYAFFGCGQGGGSASGFIFKYTDTNYTQFSGYNYGAGAGSYKPILLDTDDIGRSNGIFVNYSTTVNTPPSATEFAVRGQGTTLSTFTAKFQNNSLGDILTIRDDGNIGILTTTPSASLDIAQSGVGGDFNALFLRAGNSSTTSGSNQISFGYSAQTNYAHAIKTRHNSANAIDNGIDFHTWKFGDTAATSAGQYVMTIAGNGNLGVGTKSPAYTVDTSGSGRFTNNLIVTGSLNTSGSSTLTGTHTVTGKSALNGQVSQTVGALTIVGTTASLNLSTGNFFTLTLVAGATHINPTNITTGQTTTVLITSAVGATATFPASVKQPSGSSYTPTSAAGAKDILTLISYDTTNVYIANVKNLI